jgi:hypothetical protein
MEGAPKPLVYDLISHSHAAVFVRTIGGKFGIEP